MHWKCWAAIWWFVDESQAHSFKDLITLIERMTMIKYFWVDRTSSTYASKCLLNLMNYTRWFMCMKRKTKNIVYTCLYIYCFQLEWKVPGSFEGWFNKMQYVTCRYSSVRLFVHSFIRLGLNLKTYANSFWIMRLGSLIKFSMCINDKIT